MEDLASFASSSLNVSQDARVSVESSFRAEPEPGTSVPVVNVGLTANELCVVPINL